MSRSSRLCDRRQRPMTTPMTSAKSPAQSAMRIVSSRPWSSRFATQRCCILVVADDIGKDRRPVPAILDDGIGAPDQIGEGGRHRPGEPDIEPAEAVAAPCRRGHLSSSLWRRLYCAVACVAPVTSLEPIGWRSRASRRASSA